MSRYCVVGDPHITHKSLDRAAALFELVENIGLPVIWLGDFLDTKEVIRGKCLNALIAYLKSSKLRHIVIIGNHDWFNLECKAHALEALKLIPNVTVVDEPMKIDGLNFFPYIHDKLHLEALLAAFTDRSEVLFAHLEVSQFDFGNGHICTSTGIQLDALKNLKRVISGHFHKHQEAGNLTYLGTPFSHSFGETNQVKYIGMYDSETNEFKLAETPFPQHITIEFNCDDLEDDSVVWDYSQLKDPSNFYRIILTGRQENMDRFPRDLFTNLNIKWISRPSDDIVNNVSIDETSSNEVQFSKWATEIRKMDPETLKLGLEILEACK